jgi:hypothetical protein
MRRAKSWAVASFVFLGIGGLALWFWQWYPPAQEFQPAQFETGDPRGAPLPIVGEWGQAVDGVRCRIRCDRNDVSETERLLSAIEIQNTSGDAKTFVGYGAPPWSGEWMLDTIYNALGNELTTGQYMKGKIKVPAQTTLELWRNLLFIEPVAPGRHLLNARIWFNGGFLAASGVEMNVRPADWGPESNGLRLRVALPWQQGPIAAGSKFFLETFVQNTKTYSVDSWYFDLGHPRVERKGDSFTFICAAFTDQHNYPIFPGQLDRHGMDVGGDINTAGDYPVKVIFEAPDTESPGQKPWSGRMESNVLVIHTVVPPSP